MKIIDAAVSALRRRVLGISPEEIRFTLDDVRSEIRAVRAELREEVAALRRELDTLPSRQDRARGPEIPVAEA
jgi:hypothetical protein